MKLYQNKNLYQIILILFGIIMLSGFIWLRFIRPRLPKEIPFNLSLLGFFILLYLCGIYLYIVISLFRKAKPMNPILKEIIGYIYLPLEALDHYLKDLPYINKAYKRCIVFSAFNLHYFVVSTNLFYYIFEIFPRILLVTVLFTDIFGHHELYFIYKFLLLSVFILVSKYIKYSLKYAKEYFIESLETKLNIIMAYEYAIQVVDLPPKDEDDYLPETMGVPLKDFIDFQTTTFINQKEYYPYMTFRLRYDDSYYTERNLPQPRKYTSEEFKTRIQNILQLSLLIAYYDITQTNNKVKILRILIFLNYLICWLYILLMSFPSLFYASFWELWIIFSIQDLKNPFL
jgi:hypothetical protein